MTAPAYLSTKEAGKQKVRPLVIFSCLKEKGLPRHLQRYTYAGTGRSFRLQKFELSSKMLFCFVKSANKLPAHGHGHFHPVIFYFSVDKKRRERRGKIVHHKPCGDTDIDLFSLIFDINFHRASLHKNIDGAAVRRFRLQKVPHNAFLHHLKKLLEINGFKRAVT